MTKEQNGAAYPDAALAEIRNDVGRRIRPLCTGWPEPDLLELIERIALIKHKYDRLADVWFPRAPRVDS
jgi:hypothetical protein